MKLLISFIVVAVCSFHLSAQEYSIAEISKDLKVDAYAIVRYEECYFTQTDLNNATEKVTKVITILNDKGKDLAYIHLLQDKFRKLKSFSGEIILESGHVFKKIGKGDLTTTAISHDLATDDFWTYYYCSSPSYPFTIKYSYEIKWENGIVGYPVFAPMSPNVALEKSVHSVQFPTSLAIRYKDNAASPKPEKKVIGKDSVYTWTLENQQAISPEPLSPSFYTLTPLVYIAPDDFCYDGACGNLSTWQTTGIFLSQLLNNRDVLPIATVDKVKGLVADNTRETVRRIYEYLQKNTRYVSIQLGIGGFQPFSAGQVDKTGFGDCKALSNYMKAMLSVVGIESEYAIVHTEKKHMFSDFSSMNQANHAILCIPLQEDSIWLECTSKEYYFDYIHSGISGHDALLVSGENSKLVKIRNISQKMNTEKNWIQIELQSDASITSSVKSQYKNQEIEGMVNFVINLSEKEKMNVLAKDLSVQRPQISNVQADYIKSQNPEINLSYTMNSQMYANKTGSRLFVPVNPFRNPMGKVFSSATRKYDIHIGSPTYQTDSISITIPEGYVVESKPKSLQLKSPFGIFTSVIEETDGKINLTYQTDIPLGKYPVSSYAEIREFFGNIDKNLNGKIVLKLKE